MTINIPRGTKDILPKEIIYWQFIEATARLLFKLYNYHEIRTPIFEDTILFSQAIGEETDIVNKEMYTFLDKKGRSLTLRPEGTASVVRAYLSNENQLKNPDVTRLFYMGPMFRYERPQAGRFRQFHQIGVEAIGGQEPVVDAEIIILTVDLFNKFNLDGLKILLNSLGCQKCQPPFKEELKKYLKNKFNDLCSDCRLRIDKNIMRVFDCKEENCQKTLLSAPKMIEFLCQECEDHFSQVKYFLQKKGIEFHLDARLVRGLDYYIRTAFEVVTPQDGRQNAVCGGGRYLFTDKKLFDEEVNGVGFAFGLERLVNLIQQKEISFSNQEPTLFIATLGKEALLKALVLADKLRKQNKIVEVNTSEKSLKAQMRYADKNKFSQVLIIGDEEVKKGRAVLKEMISGTEKEVLLDSLGERTKD